MSADHAGRPLAAELIRRLRRAKVRIRDVSLIGTASDYPDAARAVTAQVLAGRACRGLLLCGSGVGAAIAANKLEGIRAGLCHDPYSARQGVEHDDVNVLVLGARVVGVELAACVVDAFLQARFSGGARHQRRLAKIRKIEQRAGTPRRGLALKRPGRTPR